MLKLFTYLFIFIIKLVLPVDKNLIVFGHRAGRRFGDNSRSLFIYLNRTNSIKKYVWITKSNSVKKNVEKLGYNCCYYNSLAGLYYSLRAKWHVYDCTEGDINEPITKLSNNINLWHGVVLKKLSAHKKTILSVIIYKLSSIFFKKYIVYPNKIYSRHLLDHFPKNKFKLIISNSPRNIFMYNNDIKKLNYFKTNEEKRISNYLKTSKKKILGYFPTWRFDGMEIFPNKINTFELKKLNNYLNKNNLILVIKKHPNSFFEDKHRLYNKNSEKTYKKISKLKGFFLIDYDVDLNAIMHNCDMLISDYSGAIFDFLITKKPIILYAPDLKSYSLNPGMNFNLKQINIGPIVNNIDQLIKELNKFLKYKNFYSNKYNKSILLLKNKIFKNDNCFANIIKKIN